MSTSNLKPVYPAGIFPWVDKVDNQDIDFAVDINSTVAEVESVETTLGTNPQIETAVPVGLPVAYSTVSARISDAMTANQMPYSSLALSTLVAPGNNAGTLVPFKANIDPYGCYNGNDITIPANGWWTVSSSIQWSWWDSGYSHHMLTLNGKSNIVDEQLIDWTFSGNTTGVEYSPSGQVVSKPSILIARYVQFGKRPLRTKVWFEGALHKGDRLSVYAENGTNNSNLVMNNLTMKAIMNRTIPSSITFTSG